MLIYRYKEEVYGMSGRYPYTCFGYCIMNEKMTSEQLLPQLLDILCEFDRLCNDTGIQYSLYGGTLLGAIRERGFIPWDDDADVFMTRENFKCLEEVLHKTQSDYYIRGNIKKQFCQLGNPNVWVDIFICDYISDRPVFRKIKQILLSVLDIMYRDRESAKLSNLNQYGSVKRLGFKAAFAIGRIVPKNWTAKLYCWISEKRFLGNKQNLFRSNDQYNGRKLLFPAECMKQYGRVVFEDRTLSVTEKWDHFLVQSYGEEYMIPVRDERNSEVHNLIRSEEKMKL